MSIVKCNCIVYPGTIAASWIVSPLISGTVCVGILTLIRKFIMDARDPLKAGLIALPIIYGLTIFVNVLTVTLNGSKREKTSPPLNKNFFLRLISLSVLGMENMALWMVFVVSIGAMIVVAVLCQIFVVPWQRKKILNNDTTVESKMYKNSIGQSVESVSTVAISTVSINAPVLKNQKVESDAKVNRLFHFLQTLSAVFSSFAHGGSDVR